MTPECGELCLGLGVFESDDERGVHIERCDCCERFNSDADASIAAGKILEQLSIMRLTECLSSEIEELFPRFHERREYC